MSRIKKRRVSQEVHFSPESRFSKKTLFTIILAGLLVFSVFGIVLYGFSDSQNSVTYQGHTFTRTAKGWTTRIDQANVEFLYTPANVEELTVDPLAVEHLLNAPMIYLVVDPTAAQISDLFASASDSF